MHALRATGHIQIIPIHQLINLSLHNIQFNKLHPDDREMEIKPLFDLNHVHLHVQ